MKEVICEANICKLKNLDAFVLVLKRSKFYEEKFDIIFAKSRNRHKDDYTLIYFAKII